MNVSSSDADYQGACPFWALTNDIDSVYDLYVADKTFLYGQFYRFSEGGAEVTTSIRECYGGFLFEDYCACSANTQYFLLIKRASSTFTCKIYSSDALRTAGGTPDVDTLTLNLQSAPAFRYIFGCVSYGGTSDLALEADINNLDIGADYTSPTYQNVDSNATSIQESGTILLYGQGYDEIGLDWAWLSTNETGTWKNYTNIAFYDLSDNWTTISGTGYHSFEPVHKTDRMVEVNKVIDGETRKYLAYDCDAEGSEIRLYYTNNSDSTWTAYSGNPILGVSANHYRLPSTIYNGSAFHMFLCDRTDTKMERWTSTNGTYYTYQEDIVSLTYEWGGVPYIWYSTDDAKWYFSYSDKINDVSKTYLRNATNIVDLDSASSTLIYDGFSLWSIVERNDRFWGLSEKYITDWKVHAHSSTFINKNWAECVNSPTLTNDDACPKLILNVTGSTGAYLFTNRDRNNWYQDTRKVNTSEYHFPIDLDDVADTWTWSNFTWSNSSISAGTQIQWRIYYNDTYGNVNGTSIHTFTVGIGETFTKHHALTINATLTH